MAIGLHTIKGAQGATKKRKRVGRGNASGHGTYSTRGQKGQRARSGVSGLKRLGFRDTLRRIPKKRGFKSQKPGYVTLNLDQISNSYKSGEKVTVATLQKKKIIGKMYRERGVKILGRGELDKKLMFQGVKFTNSAIEKIKKSGSEIADQK